jgi:hypothetical protein
MSVMWFILGALVVLFVMLLSRWITKDQVALSWLSWFGIILGGLLFFFSLAWCITSVVEGEHQAAIMGLVFFGVPSLIILGLSGKKSAKKI